MMRLIVYISCFVGLISGSCNQQAPSNTTKKDNPSSGTAVFLVDENYKQIMGSAFNVFQAHYKKSNIQTQYVSERQAINQLLEDSVDLILVTRQLNQEEEQVFKDRQFTAKQTPIAVDALVFICNPKRKVSDLTQDQVKNLFLGNITQWNELSKAEIKKDITLVFDNTESGQHSYVKDSILQGKAIAAKAFATKSIHEIIDYISKNEFAIGLISLSWVSDVDDKNNQQFKEQIKILGIWNEKQTESFKPYQAYLATKDYPYRRKLMIINTQGYQGLGNGFTGFMTSDSGQKLILKSGLLPVTAPIRLIQVK